MADYLLTPKGHADLAQIWAESADRWGQAQADTYVTALTGTFALIADFPSMAPLRREFTPPLRIHPHGSHLILYVGADPITIVRVLHGRQDLLAALDG
ncbi:type II toxin-antitoxin system RelE/ParE family toxin [Falsirhodobacter deserti]|uniref:type II toxin-antitoxin system RelE/ParE family toxin n=1 Tax=Falsirhodobacter deserti TaxID=1365611 RepID=UPI000FE366D7|nr:type II toxin-antitoxin system RelE/ParE family toxin [Falsirhodobacter deserti]